MSSVPALKRAGTVSGTAGGGYYEKNIILGSTGSIGTNALEVVRKSNENFK